MSQQTWVDIGVAVWLGVIAMFVVIDWSGVIDFFRRLVAYIRHIH